MKKPTHANFLICSLALFIGSLGVPRAEEPVAKKLAKGDKMMDCCQVMRKQKLKMNEALAAQDAALTKQLDLMNSAPEEKKMSRMAAVITLMVEQRIAIAAQRTKTNNEMMKHMMMHIRKSEGTTSPDSPMKNMRDMNGMGGMGGIVENSKDAQPRE